METSRAILLPDYGLPSAETLKTLALFWDGVDMPLYERLGNFRIRGSEDQQTVGEFDALAFAGVVRPMAGPEPDRFPSHYVESETIARVWRQAPEHATAVTLGVELGAQIVEARAVRSASQYAAVTQEIVAAAAANAITPVTSGWLSSVVGSLPPELSGEMRPEAVLMNVAVRGITVAATTPVELVLRFRDKHRHEAGRLRASLIDLSSRIETATSASAVGDQAEAVLANRVEPALADLERELKRSGISFFLRTVFGLSGVVTGAATAPVAIRGGAIAGRALGYAFDRDALIRSHPFGYLYRARSKFPSPGDWRQPLKAPHLEVADFIRISTSPATGLIRDIRSCKP